MDLNQLLTTIRDDHSFKARIFAFAALPQDLQRIVLDSGKTIADGAKVVLGVIAPPQAAMQLLANAA